MTFVGLEQMTSVILLFFLWTITIFVLYWLYRKSAALEQFEKVYKENLNYTGTSLKMSLFLRAVLIFIISSLLTIVILRPANGVESTAQSQSDLDIALVVDISLSMGVKDVKNHSTSRLSASQQVLKDLLHTNASDKYSLISYSSFATTEVPLTFDKATLETGIDTLRVVDYSYANGSSVATGLEEAYKRLTANKDASSRRKAIVIIGDGEDLDTTQGIANVLANLKKEQIPVFSIGVGTEAGDKIPYYVTRGGETFYIAENGSYAISKLKKDAFVSISKETGGEYFSIDSDLNALYDKINSQGNQTFIQGSGKIYRELYYYVVPFIILSVIFIGFKLYEVVRPKFEKKLLQFNPISVFSVLAFPIIYVSLLGQTISGNLLYTQEKYAESAKVYQEIIQKDGNNSIAHHNLGNSQYRDGMYTESIQSFKKAAESSDLKVKEWAEYNKGNAQYRLGEKLLADSPQDTVKNWEDAIKSYENALAIDPNDREAKENLEFVKKKLEELKKKLSENQGEGQNQNEGEENSEEKERIQEAEKEAKDRYNRFGRYRNNDNYENNGFGTGGSRW